MLHSTDPITQLDIKPHIKNKKKIREENNFELYQQYYFAEINKRKEVKFESDNTFSM